MGSPATTEAPVKKKPPRKISMETFLRKYRKGGPGIKYEYNKGVIEKTEAMKRSERYIIENLRREFNKTEAYNIGGSLECEFEVFTSTDQWRKPDLSFMTREQIKAITDDFEPVPEFVIEVISKNDKVNEVRAKVYEYFKAGVKIIWHILPEFKEVEIYLPNEDIKILGRDEICSAEPVVKGLKIKAVDIFKEL